MMKKILTVIGARPQFIKCSPVSKHLLKYFHEEIVHTGQHYDINMSELFFQELDLPKPSVNLNVGSGSHAEQTARMMIKLEKKMFHFKPDLVLLYGDTNSTIAGAIVAAKLNIPLAHIEAGLRSFNRKMPEEINRIITDILSTLLFCPTDVAVNNLLGEGIKEGVFLTGDVMLDAFQKNLAIAERNSKILNELNLKKNEYILLTLHRAENTDNHYRLTQVFEALNETGENFIIPIHPRTKKNLDVLKLEISNNIRIVNPVGYLDMLMLEKNSRLIMTDSGGVQKEAYFLEKPCITLRTETEWIETVTVGVNSLVGTDKEKIISAIKNFKPGNFNEKYYGDGNASLKITEIMLKYFS